MRNTLCYAKNVLKLIFVGVESIYNVVFSLGVQQSESVTQTLISTCFRFFSHIGHYTVLSRVSCGSVVKNPSAMQRTQVLSLEKGMATHFSILVWEIPMDRGAWRAIVHGVPRNWIRLSN